MKAYVVIVTVLAGVLGGHLAYSWSRHARTWPAVDVPAQPDPWAEVVDYICAQESRRGKADTSRPGPASEMGRFQLTPIWLADLARIRGRAVDPYTQDANEIHLAITDWLTHYLGPAAWQDPERCYRAFRYGPKGADR